MTGIADPLGFSGIMAGQSHAITGTGGHPVVDFVHEALLYRDSAQFLAGTAPFVLDGLSADDPVLVAVPQRGIDLLKGELGDQADRVEFLNMTEAGRNPGRIIPGVLTHFANTHPTGRPRIIGEPIWHGRSAVEYPACVQHEALINTAFDGRRVSILCPYDTTALDAAWLDDAARTHPVMVEERRRWPSEGYGDPFGTAEAFNQPLPAPPESALTRSFDLHNLVTMRALVSDFASRAGLTEDQVEDLVLAVNELTTNSILHATGHGILAIWQEGPSVVCQVTDEGRLSNPMVGRLQPGPNSKGGYGVVMVNLLCDLVRIHSHEQGTTIRVHIG
jgi:anti-sigma regulatory factor (Ser/Thr protein kinase)